MYSYVHRQLHDKQGRKGRRSGEGKLGVKIDPLCSLVLQTFPPKHRKTLCNQKPHVVLFWRRDCEIDGIRGIRNSEVMHIVPRELAGKHNTLHMHKAHTSRADWQQSPPLLMTPDSFTSQSRAQELVRHPVAPELLRDSFMQPATHE
jgi:hypothetical protein